VAVPVTRGLDDETNTEIVAGSVKAGDGRDREHAR
jgi:hypothetical protein